MKMKILGILLLVVSLQAETLKGGYLACTSEEAFDQITTAIAKKDNNLFTYLLKNGCFQTKKGIPISVLDTSWGTAKIRAYAGNQSFVLWTNTENIQR